jgi:glycosyltransferase involved in cell wall biosynthesis
LTGAPRIILRLLDEFARRPGLNCTTILHNHGILGDSFSRHSDVFCLDIKRKYTRYLQRMIDSIVRRATVRSAPTIALVNSIESRFIGKALAHCGIPLISLIHELPDSYDAADFQLIAETSQRVVFPAKIVQESALELAPFSDDQTAVIPQGLLANDFGSRYDRETAKQMVHAELGIPADAKIVLGCGTIDLRKGIDLFAHVAQAYLRRQGIPETHFLWIGEGPRWRHSPFHFVQLDLRKSGIEDQVHFAGQRDDVEPYFCAADFALMVSREDPFPCVVHEAMACGLPTIAFDGAGGAPEALSDGAGIVVPYGDCEAAAYEIQRLQLFPDYYRLISSQAKERVRSKYNFADYARAIGSELERALKTDLGFRNTRFPLRKTA